MSIQTELARIKGAKADLKSWVEENGVVVPDGTLIDGLVELAKTVETGGGGDTQIDGLIDRSITEISNSRVTKVGSYALALCTNLTTANIPAATSIGDGAFNDCTNLTTANLPAATTIGNYAFNKCAKLTTLILREANAVCTMSNISALSFTPIASGTGYIYVPASLVDSYKAAKNWSKYADQIRAIEDYPDITGGAA